MARGNITSKSFAATGTTSKLHCSSGLVIIGDDSSWTATFKIKYTYTQNDGTEVTRTLKSSAGTDLSISDDMQYPFDFQTNVKVFVECTAYTSGTIPVDIKANPIVYGD